MAPRITSARERNKRSASKRPTSSASRASRSRASSNSSNVTSDRLRKELEGVKRRNNTTSARNRAARSRTSTASTTQGRGVTRTTGNARGTQGPARASVQGPRTPSVQGPSRATGGGLLGSRQPPTKTPSQPPRVKGTPGVAGGSGSLQVRNAIQNTGRGISVARALTSGNPYSATGLAIAHDIMNRGVNPGTLEGRTPAEMGTQQQGPPAPKAKTKSKPAFKAPTKKPAKNTAVLSKKGGKTGSLVNGLFIAHPWSAEQRMRYAARGGK
tara:strand:- start:229 stop:1038 length:810 start_codon:yes stop_codon:yes gene_type:complete